MLVLHTSAVSALIHRDASAWLRLRQEGLSGVYLCSPVAAEIRLGLFRLEGSRRHRLLSTEYERLRKHVRWVDWRESATRAFCDLKASLWRRGEPIDDFDLLTASVALTLPARLATRDARPFFRIEDLEISDWSAPFPPG